MPVNKSNLMFQRAVALALVMFTVLLSFAIIPSDGAADVPVVVSPTLVLFDQDYSTMDEVPDNVFTALVNAVPYVSSMIVSYSDTTDSVRMTLYKGQKGQGYISGLVPTTTSTVNISLSWTSTYTASWAGCAVNINIGGILLNCYHGTLPANPYYVRGQYYNSTGSLISMTAINMGANPYVNATVTSYISNGTANVKIGNNSLWVPFYRQAYIQDTASYVFTPDTISISATAATFGSTSDSIIVDMYRVTQTINSSELITAVGSSKHQAIGYDGPHPMTTVYDGMERIRSENMTGTIFADVDYVTNATYMEYLNGLIDDGWELGIHFSESLDEMSYEDAVALMDVEYNEIGTLFGTPPLTWCSLGNGENATHAAYAKTALNMVWRNYKVVYQNLPGSHNIVNISADYWMGVANGSYSTAPVYLHETEVEPATSSSVDRSIFHQYLNTTFAGDVRLVGYYEWYKIQSNQFDATFIKTSDDYGESITASTNGYNAMMVYRWEPTEDTIVMCDGESVEYSTTPEGYILIEVEDGKEYMITTLDDYRQLQFGEAISPIFAIIPLVIIVSVIPMVMGLGRKLK